MNLYSFSAPQQVKAATLGGQPFYFDCGLCGAREPVLFGYIGSGPGWLNVGVIEKGGFVNPAYLCEGCFKAKGGAQA